VGATRQEGSRMTIVAAFLVGFLAALLLRRRAAHNASAEAQRDTAVFALRQLTLAMCARQHCHETPALQARAYARAQAVLAADLDRRFPNRRTPRQAAPAVPPEPPPKRVRRQANEACRF
jgi:hypothetical protein